MIGLVRKVALAGLVLLGGCLRVDEVPETVDRLLFKHLGGSLFGDPNHLSMKAIHLDNGALIGKEVVLEGAVLEVSEYFTYLVMSDETARMLVVLADLEGAGPMLQDRQPRILRVLGVVEGGKKGLPYVTARSLNILTEPDQA